MRIFLIVLLLGVLSVPLFSKTISVESNYQKQDVMFKLDKVSLAVNTYARLHGIDPLLIYAIIGIESSFNPRAKSHAGCIGLMQINPKAHKSLMLKLNIKHNDLYKIDNNIRLGTIILKNYIKEHKSVELGIKRYNGSKNMAYTNKVMKRYKQLKEL